MRLEGGRAAAVEFEAATKNAVVEQLYLSHDTHVQHVPIMGIPYNLSPTTKINIEKLTPDTTH